MTPIRPPAPDRRGGRLPAALLAAALLLAGRPCAAAPDFSLPRLEDLRPKWAALGMGVTSELVLQVMGTPNGRSETQTMGLAQLTLEWKDIHGYRYAAKFLANRLYAKEMADNR